MSRYHEVSRETYRAPKYATRTEAVWNETWRTYGSVTRSTKTPTGEYVETIYVTWRCGNCRALAVSKEHDEPPKECMKCHS